MAVIAIANQKGGVGKTTTAVALARYLRDKDAVLVDADIQRSAAPWARELGVPCTEISEANDLFEEIPRLLAPFVIIDGPAASPEVTRVIIERADLVIVPCQATALDVRGTTDIVRQIRHVQELRRVEHLGRFFLNRAGQKTKLLREAQEALPQYFTDIPLLKQVIHNRQCIASVATQFSSVWDSSSPELTTARTEYESLFTEVLTCLEH